MARWPRAWGKGWWAAAGIALGTACVYVLSEWLPEVSVFLVLSASGSAAVTGALVLIAKTRPHWFARPSMLIVLAYHVRIQWPSVFMEDQIRGVLQDPGEFLLVTHGFPVLCLTAGAFAYGLRESTARRAWAAVAESSQQFVAVSDRLVRVMLPLCLVIVAYYVWTVPWTGTGLYALIMDPINSPMAREESFKLLDDWLLRYLYLWHLNTFGPLLLVGAVCCMVSHRRDCWRIGYGAVAVFTAVSMVLVGHRGGFAIVAVATVAAWVIGRGRGVRWYHVGVMFSAATVVGAWATLARQAHRLSAGALLEYAPVLWGRMFATPVEVGTYYIYWAHAVGFTGISSVRPLAWVAGLDYVDLANEIGRFYFRSTLASVSANASFVYAYYPVVGIGTVVVGALGVLLFDVILVPLARVPDLRAPMLVLFGLNAMIAVETTLTTAFVSGGYVMMPIVAILWAWLRPLGTARLRGIGGGPPAERTRGLWRPRSVREEAEGR